MNVGGVLITNNSDHHPPETWAATSAAMIFSVDNSIDGARRIEAMKLQAALAERLVEFHRRVQEEEQQKLDSNEDHHASPTHDVSDETLDGATNAVMEAANGSPWEESFKDEGMRNRIRDLLGNHFATSMQIHRQRHRVRKGMPAHLPTAGDEWQKGYEELMANSRREAEEAEKNNKGQE